MKNKKTNENIFDAGRRFTDAFFDGLKRNATNKALLAAKKNPHVPPPIVKKMAEIDKLSKELDRMLNDESYLDDFR
jgi:hypothetical protein